MDEFKLKVHTRPEAKIQQALEMFLKARDWYVHSTHGNMYQSGFPDMYCHHRKYRARWIEVKVKDHYSFTPAQMIEYPKMSGFGVGIWILTAATEDEYRKLWLPPNWHEFLPQFKANSRRVTKSHNYVPKYPIKEQK